MQNNPLRCAIYTRKSTEDGLEKEFNSLHAQREACEAYIRSQKHEGWNLIPTAYDDGGFSGGSMERPALKALLADIAAGAIDIVVVYKVDRLSRSLHDFAQMVKLFDAHHVSFISITQQFNTTSSMGRLTLNILLSFAQFEREVIGERVRDKIAASKQKGMWMGGVPPLGYDVATRKLVINPEEAALVQKIFTAYAAQQSLNRLAQTLNAEGHCNKCWITANGATRGGQAFTNQSLSKILNNPAYLGRTRHRDKTYNGQHEAIISQELWEQTQALLKQNFVRKKSAAKINAPRLLAGKCVDEQGRPFTASFSTKHKTKRYYYYLQKATGRRIRATALDALVATMLKSLAYVPEIWPNSSLPAANKTRWQILWHQWTTLPHALQHTLVQQVVEKATITPEQLTLHLRTNAIGTALENEALAPWLHSASTPDKTNAAPGITATQTGEHIILTAPLTGPNRTQTPHTPNPTLLKALARCHRWHQLLDDRKTTITALARETKLGRPYISRILTLKFLAPDIVKAILDGTQPAGLQLKQLMNGLPIEWEQQRRILRI